MWNYLVLFREILGHLSFAHCKNAYEAVAEHPLVSRIVPFSKSVKGFFGKKMKKYSCCDIQQSVGVAK